MATVPELLGQPLGRGQGADWYQATLPQNQRDPGPTTLCPGARGSLLRLRRLSGKIWPALTMVLP